MPHVDLILTLTLGFAAALVAGYATQRIGISPIVGYLIAGIAIGPHTPGVMADRELAEQLAEVGVILLMFGVGLQFHVEELLAVRRVAIPGALGQSAAATVLGTLVGWWLGHGWAAGIVFGLAISVASTVVLVRVLADHNQLHTRTGHIAIGWLVVEDVFTVAVLVALPAVLNGGGGAAGLVSQLGIAALKLGAVVLLTFLLGQRAIPWLLSKIAETRSRELFTLTVLVVALGIAVGSAVWFGVSMALGAFLAGMVVGRSEFSLRAATEALPMRDAFAVLFFVSVGMLFDPRQVLAVPLPFMLTAAVVMLGKPLAALLIVRRLGYPLRTGLAVAVVLGQVGEFSFILAGLGHSLGVLPAELRDAVVATALVSIAVNPLAFRTVNPIERWAQRHPRLWAWLSPRLQQDAAATDAQEEHGRERPWHAIIVGYGPVGQTVNRLLHENGIGTTIVDLNLDVVRRLREQGIAAVYGDATHADTLREAGIEQAQGLILSAAGLHSAPEIIRLARQLNPHIRILARAAYVREQGELRAAGAHAVYSGEGEVALAFTELMLRSLGATAEQIDRERERVRAELDAELPKAGISLTATSPRDSVEPIGQGER
ncbi:MAG TPA: cation:proton antiporter [Planctomycetota bacterium]|nr:cation:proton antiporter [Planctomycetota bacterium]